MDKRALKHGISCMRVSKEVGVDSFHSFQDDDQVIPLSESVCVTDGKNIQIIYPQGLKHNVAFISQEMFCLNNSNGKRIPAYSMQFSLNYITNVKLGSSYYKPYCAADNSSTLIDLNISAAV